MTDNKPGFDGPNYDEYLGDGVYATFDGYHIWLDTRAQSNVNRVALEPSVFVRFLKYREKLNRELGPQESQI